VFESQKSNMALTNTFSSPSLWFAIPLGIVLLVCLALMIELYKFYIKNELFKRLHQELSLNRLSLHNTYFKHQLLHHYLKHIQLALSTQNFTQSSDLLVQLSTVIKNIIAKTEKNPSQLSVVLLEEEIYFVENYLHFIHLQTSRPFEFRKKNSRDVKITNQLVPFLFFQPVLEITQQIQNQQKNTSDPFILEFEILDRGDQWVFQFKFPHFICEPKEELTSFETYNEALDRIELLKDLGIPCSMSIENHSHSPNHCLLGLSIKKDWKIPFAASH
jgi:hypothetical protein